MNRVGQQSVLLRVALYSLGLSVALLVLATIANRIGAPSEPCEENLPAGVPHLWGTSITAIALAWFAVISGSVALVGTAAGLTARLRYPDDDSRWSPGTWALLLICPVGVLIAAVVTLTGLYSLTVGHLADCV